MPLSSSDFEQLHQALLRAFPTYSELQHMVLSKMNQNLEVIAGNNNLSSVAFQLISWAEARGQMDLLVAGACKAKPEDNALSIFAKALNIPIATSTYLAAKSFIPRNDTLLTAPDHCVFTNADVIESLIMALLFKEKVYIEDNGWFLNGSFTKYARKYGSLVAPALEQGYLVPTFRSWSNSFEEYLVDSGMLMSPSMGMPPPDTLLMLAELYDRHLPKVPAADFIRHVTNEDVGNYDKVLSRLFRGVSPVQLPTTPAEENINRIWDTYGTLREDWLSEAFRIRNEGRDGKPFNSAAKSSFVKMAAKHLCEDGVENATELFKLRNKSQVHSDLIQIVKWAHDAYYIARGETLKTGSGFHMPTQEEAAMVRKQQEAIGNPTDKMFTDRTFQILMETFIPPMKSLANADPGRLLACRKIEGTQLINNINGWARSCHIDGEEDPQTQQWAKAMQNSFEQYGNALRKCCPDGGPGMLSPNFFGSVTTNVSLAGAIGFASAEITAKFSTSLYQYLPDTENTTITLSGAMSTSAWVAYGYSTHERSSTHQGSDSAVNVISADI